MTADFCTSSYGWTKLDKKNSFIKRNITFLGLHVGVSPLKCLTQWDESTSVGVSSPRAMTQYSTTIVTSILSTTLRACLVLNSASMIILGEYISSNVSH
jgi:hypothetical protein